MEHGWFGLYTSLKSRFKSRDLELLCQDNVTFWQFYSKLEWFFYFPAHLNLCNIDLYWNHNIWNCHIAVHWSICINENTNYTTRKDCSHQHLLYFLGLKTIQVKTNKQIKPLPLFHFTFIFLSPKFRLSYITRLSKVDAVCLYLKYANSFPVHDFM